MEKRQLVRLGTLIALIIIILLMIIRCSSQPDNSQLPDTSGENIEKSTEFLLFEEMKEDERYLYSLYERADICSEEWIEEFLDLARKFQSYNYDGTDSLIYEFLEEYAVYGKELENVGEFLKENDLETSLEKIGQLEVVAKDMEDRLNEFAKKYS